MPKNAKKSPYLKQKFDLYLAWRCLPSLLHGKDRETLEKFGFDYETYSEIYDIRTQTEFAKKFGIRDPGTLTDWNKKIEEENLIEKKNQWALKMTSDVIFALYRKIMKTAKARDVRLWYEIVEGRKFGGRR